MIHCFRVGIANPKVVPFSISSSVVEKAKGKKGRKKQKRRKAAAENSHPLTEKDAPWCGHLDPVLGRFMTPG